MRLQTFRTALVASTRGGPYSAYPPPAHHLARTPSRTGATAASGTSRSRGEEPIDPDVLAENSQWREGTAWSTQQASDAFRQDVIDVETAEVVEEDKELDENAKVNEVVQRKAAVLLDIIGAGPRLEAKIAQHREEIDEVLVAFLLKRLVQAQEAGEGQALVDGLVQLFNRLRIEAERQNATPAQRLLDDALQALNAGMSGAIDPAERRAAVQQVLADAFAGRSRQELDIFGVAAAVAQGREVPDEEYVCEMVPGEVFVAEVEQLVAAAEAKQAELREGLPRMRGTPEEAQLRADIQQRSASIAQAQEVLRIARTLL